MNYHKVIDDITIISNEDMSDTDIGNYIAHVKHKHHNRKLQSLTLIFDGEEVEIGYHLEPLHFEKIRRITGYLVGDMTRWNDGKSAEEQDRIKHA